MTGKLQFLKDTYTMYTTLIVIEGGGAGVSQLKNFDYFLRLYLAPFS